MDIDRIRSYNAAEGDHSGRVSAAEIRRNYKGEKIRIDYELLSPRSVTREYHAGHDFRPQDSDELIHVLEILTKGHPELIIGRDGKIKESELEKLIGAECDLQIVHVHKKESKHANPFCKIIQVTAPGELVDYSEESPE